MQTLSFKTLFFAFFFLLMFIGYSQSSSPTIPGLPKELKLPKHNDKINQLSVQLQNAIESGNILLEIKTRRHLGTSYFSFGNTKEAINHLIGSATIARRHNYKYQMAATNIELAEVYGFIRDLSNRYELLLKAAEIMEKKKDTFQLANVYKNLASTYMGLNTKGEYKRQMGKALSFAIRSKNKEAEADIYTSFGSFFLQEEKNDSARFVLKKAFAIEKGLDNSEKMCKILVRLARSFAPDTDSASYYMSLAHKTSIEKQHYIWTGRSLFYLAQLNRYLNKSGLAYQNMYDGVTVCKATQDLIMLRSLYKLFSTYYLQDNKIDSAFHYEQLKDATNDSLTSRKNLAKVKTLQWEYSIKEKQAEIENLKTQKQLLEQKQVAEQKARVWFWCGIIVLSILAVLLFYFLKQKSRLFKNEKLLRQSEKEKSKQKMLLKETKLKSEAERHQLEMQHKNKELASVTMQMFNKSEAIAGIKDGLEQLKQQHKKSSASNQLEKDLKKLEFQIGSHSRVDEDWETLKIHFLEVNKGFYEKLTEQYNQLTQYDLKLCTFIHLGFETKQIAQMLNIDHRSLRTQRYRMRKKMGLATDENLASHIAEIVG